MSQPIRSIKNQYRGINVHLNSFLQSEGGWKEFHTAHIGDISKTLKVVLLPMGYTVGIEPSLQISRLGESTIEPEADMMIYDSDPVRSIMPVISGVKADAGVLVLPALEILLKPPLSEKQPGAVVIYEFEPGRPRRGEPIVWIELLSPSNKGNSEDARNYRSKRLKLLESNIVFVEIDYLDRTPPAFHVIPPYYPYDGERHPAAHPYRIAVIDPRPELAKSMALFSQFDMDTPVPEVTLPLSGEDKLKFDFGLPYNKTFEELLYGLELVDYSRLPHHFERYSEADRTRIAARMLAVVKAHQTGQNLEAAPLSLEGMNPATALEELQKLLPG